MGFTAQDSSSNSVGILTVWNSSMFKLLYSIKHEGFMAAMGPWQGNNSKLGVLNIYAPQNARCKRTLWKNIVRVLQMNSKVSWVVCREFNEVRAADERKGTTYDPLSTRHFNFFISSAGLTEIRLGGRKFTWLNSDCSLALD